MKDMPFITRAIAEECVYVAKKAGLRNIRIGNKHLLV